MWLTMQIVIAIAVIVVLFILKKEIKTCYKTIAKLLEWREKVKTELDTLYEIIEESSKLSSHQDAALPRAIIRLKMAIDDENPKVNLPVS